MTTSPKREGKSRQGLSDRKAKKTVPKCDHEIRAGGVVTQGRTFEKTIELWLKPIISSGPCKDGTERNDLGAGPEGRDALEQT